MNWALIGLGALLAGLSCRRFQASRIPGHLAGVGIGVFIAVITALDSTSVSLPLGLVCTVAATALAVYLARNMAGKGTNAR